MNAKLIAGIVVVLALLVGGFALVNGQGNGVGVAKSSPTPVATSAAPTQAPTAAPTTSVPTATPTAVPTIVPTVAPTQAPTNGVITGKVTDARTGAPLANFSIIVYQFSSGMCPGVTSGSTLGRVIAVTGADGSYSSLSQAPGIYLVSATPRGSLAGQYGSWWWNNKDSCSSADQLQLTGNIGGINFAVPPSR